jgi:GYF domain 2
VIVHVCHNDGAPVGEFQEADFRDKIFAGELGSDYFYWYEGMEDWKPISDYRALARTQRIEIAPEKDLPMADEQPVAIRTGSDALVKGVIIGIIGLVVAIIGGVSASLIIGGLGALLLLFGIYLGVAGRVKS